MIGKLKKYSVRERYNQQVARVTVDIPLATLQEQEVNEQDLTDFLHNNTGTEIGFNISALDDDEQESIEDSANRDEDEDDDDTFEEVDF